MPMGGGDSPYEGRPVDPVCQIVYGTKTMFIRPGTKISNYQARMNELKLNSAEELLPRHRARLRWLDIPYGNVLRHAEHHAWTRQSRAGDAKWSEQLVASRACFRRISPTRRTGRVLRRSWCGRRPDWPQLQLPSVSDEDQQKGYRGTYYVGRASTVNRVNPNISEPGDSGTTARRKCNTCLRRD